MRDIFDVYFTLEFWIEVVAYLFSISMLCGGLLLGAAWLTGNL